MLNLLVGASLSWAFALSGLSGLITGLTIGFVFTLIASLTKLFGTVTLTWTLYSLFAIPTVLMGPPNPIKVVIGFAGGLAYDVVLAVTRYRALGYYLAWIAYTLTLIGLFFYFFVRGAGSPQAEAVSDTLKAIINIVFIVEGMLATFVGHWYYKRIKSTPLAKSFQ